MSRPRDLIHPRDEIMRTMERIYRYRMTTTSGGNISARDDDGTTWITPAGVDKGSLTRDDIVRVRPDGTTEGRHHSDDPPVSWPITTLVRASPQHGEIVRQVTDDGALAGLPGTWSPARPRR